MNLTTKQIAQLKKLAHPLKPIFQIGKNGLQDMQVSQLADVLERRELIKVTVLQNALESAKELAPELESQLACLVVQVIGRTIVLYKPSSKEKFRQISKMI